MCALAPGGSAARPGRGVRQAGGGASRCGAGWVCSWGFYTDAEQQVAAEAGRKQEKVAQRVEVVLLPSRSRRPKPLHALSVQTGPGRGEPKGEQEKPAGARPDSHYPSCFQTGRIRFGFKAAERPNSLEIVFGPGLTWAERARVTTGL